MRLPRGNGCAMTDLGSGAPRVWVEGPGRRARCPSVHQRHRCMMILVRFFGTVTWVPGK